MTVSSGMTPFVSATWLNSYVRHDSIYMCDTTKESCVLIRYQTAWHLQYAVATISRLLKINGIATISRLLKIIGLFCKISSLLQGSFAKETYNFKEPTNRSHPIVGIPSSQAIACHIRDMTQRCGVTPFVWATWLNSYVYSLGVGLRDICSGGDTIVNNRRSGKYNPRLDESHHFQNQQPLCPALQGWYIGIICVFVCLSVSQSVCVCTCLCVCVCVYVCVCVCVYVFCRRARRHTRRKVLIKCRALLRECKSLLTCCRVYRAFLPGGCT